MAVDGLRGALDRYAIAGERARLRHMSDTQLNDIGLTRHQALGEARRPFWQGRRCP
jgi:uncharacterized protein YjiS (DUF1127 family)